MTSKPRNAKPDKPQGAQSEQITAVAREYECNEDPAAWGLKPEGIVKAPGKAAPVKRKIERAGS